MLCLCRETGNDTNMSPANNLSQFCASSQAIREAGQENCLKEAVCNKKTKKQPKKQGRRRLKIFVNHGYRSAVGYAMMLRNVYILQHSVILLVNYGTQEKFKHVKVLVRMAWSVPDTTSQLINYIALGICLFVVPDVNNPAQSQNQLATTKPCGDQPQFVTSDPSISDVYKQQHLDFLNSKRFRGTIVTSIAKANSYQWQKTKTTTNAPVL